jgi:hypothetical protein
MLIVEHEAAEALRYTRLKANAVRKAGRNRFHWLFKLLGWNASDESHAALQAGKN